MGTIEPVNWLTFQSIVCESCATRGDHELLLSDSGDGYIYVDLWCKRCFSHSTLGRVPEHLLVDGIRAAQAR